MKLHMNPVYKKELKLSVRSIKTAIVIFAYNALLALIGLFSFYLTFEAGERYGSVNYGDILTVYLIMAVIEFGLVLFVVPAFTSGTISGERERQTLEILLTTNLRPIQIVLGKLASSISTVLLLAVSSIPVISIVFAVGGIGMEDLLQLLFLVLVTAIFIGSIGILFSALFKRTVPSTVFTYGAVIFLTLGTLFILGIIYLFAANAADSQSMITGNYVSPDVGNMSLILLINPVFTMISMMTQQYASNDLLRSMLSTFGTTSSFLVENWFLVSAAVQLILSGLFVLLSARLLDPLKRKTKAARTAKGRVKNGKKEKS